MNNTEFPTVTKTQNIDDYVANRQRVKSFIQSQILRCLGIVEELESLLDDAQAVHGFAISTNQYELLHSNSIEHIKKAIDHARQAKDQLAISHVKASKLAE